MYNECEICGSPDHTYEAHGEPSTALQPSMYNMEEFQEEVLSEAESYGIDVSDLREEAERLERETGSSVPDDDSIVWDAEQRLSDAGYFVVSEMDSLNIYPPMEEDTAPKQPAPSTDPMMSQYQRTDKPFPTITEEPTTVRSDSGSQLGEAARGGQPIPPDAEECERCKGEGETWELNMSRDDVDWDTCRACGGQGYTIPYKYEEEPEPTPQPRRPRTPMRGDCRMCGQPLNPDYETNICHICRQMEREGIYEAKTHTLSTRKCTYCDGSGEAYDPKEDDLVECPHCGGTGIAGGGNVKFRPSDRISRRGPSVPGTANRPGAYSEAKKKEKWGQEAAEEMEKKGTEGSLARIASKEGGLNKDGSIKCSWAQKKFRDPDTEASTVKKLTFYFNMNKDVCKKPERPEKD